jgi:periplasmic copper chaperone A
MKRLALLIVAALAALLALAGPASAHVTVTAPGAVAGGSDQEITFRVPVEKNVDTTAVTIALPTDTPIASVEVQAMPGWTHTEKTAKLATPIKTDDGDITEAVSQVTWTASAGNGLKPGEFGAFTIIAGQLPNAKSLTFRALQTYSDGSVVKWIEQAAPGSTAEPENPAPVLTLAAATGAAKSGASTSAAPATAKAKAAGNTGPVVLSIIALVVAAGALGLAVVTRARSRG